MELRAQLYFLESGEQMEWEYLDYLCPLMPSASEVAGVARGSVGV